MSTSACWRRVRALEDSGAIVHYGAILDAETCGLEFHAVLNVVLTRHEEDSQTRFVRAVLERDEVLDCYSTTGDSDYHMRVRCRNKEDYNRFLEEFLFRIPGIATVRTNLILREIKHNHAVPL